jgi:hypothetical protein
MLYWFGIHTTTLNGVACENMHIAGPRTYTV